MKKIIFFDGVCNLCNHFVDFLLKIDKKHQVSFASLQGNTAKSQLPEQALSNPSTVVYLKNNKLYFRSRAVLEVLKDIGWPYKILYIFILIPSPLRDILYKLISKHRYKLFGQRQTCRLPTPSEQKYFLD